MKNKTRRSPVSVLCSALGTLLILLLIALCVPLAIPQFFGYEPYTVVTGSMEPEIPVGSLVYIQHTDAALAEPGEVVAFYGARDSAAIITHRVVENHVVMGEIITKGDANQTNDMNPVTYDNFIGTVVISVPKLGSVAQIITSTDGKTAVACVIGLAVVLHVISMIIDKERTSKISKSTEKI